MKIAAVKASFVIKESVPEQVNIAWRIKLNFGREYIIPKPFDPRLISIIAPAVAKAAMDSGVNQLQIGINTKELLGRLGMITKWFD
jgi:malate dehydrogenase (oxaloacetate-decarboxylating)(NADP+)